MLLLCFVLEHI